MPLFNGDGTSLEQEDIISGATKQAVKAVSQGTQQQAKAANQSFVDQLYGNVSSGDESLDPNNPAPNTPPAQNAAAPTVGKIPAANPNEQSQLDETRVKLAALQQQHNKSYVGRTFGEEAQQKRQEREAEEKQLEQQEEEEKLEREAAEKARMEESMQSFQQGKNSHGPAQLSDPVAVTQAKTKTEINRGSSG